MKRQIQCVGYVKEMGGIGLPHSDVKTQEENVKKYAASNGWDYLKTYAEKDSTQDGQFQEMKSDGIARAFNMVIFDSLYCFGSGLYSAVDVLKSVFCPAGIGFAVVSDNFCLEGKSGAEASAYLNGRRDSYRLLRSHIARANRNGVYGYDCRDSVLTVNKPQSEAVREIFQMRGEERKLSEIAGEMDRRGYRPPQKYKAARQWTAKHIAQILSETAYIGQWRFKAGGNLASIECPPIIEVSLFRKAQKISPETKGKPAYPENSIHPGQIKPREGLSGKAPKNLGQISAEDCTADLERQLAKCEEAAHLVFQKMLGENEKILPLFQRHEAGELSDENYRALYTKCMDGLKKAEAELKQHFNTMSHIRETLGLIR